MQGEDDDDESRCNTDTRASCCCLISCVLVQVGLVILIVYDRRVVSWNAIFANVGGVGDGFCFDASIETWVTEETSLDEDAKQIMAKDIKENDLVRTIDLLGTNTTSSIFIWTRANNMDVFWGDWKTHSLSFKTGDRFKIRSPYLMMILKKGSWKEQGVWCVLRADNIKAVDEMKIGIMISRVSEIHHKNESDPVNIKTEHCSMDLNNIFAYRYCDSSHTTRRLVSSANNALKAHKSSKCKDHYNKASTNFVPWIQSYKQFI